MINGRTSGLRFLIPKRFTATNENGLHFEFESLARLPLAFLNALA